MVVLIFVNSSSSPLYSGVENELWMRREEKPLCLGYGDRVVLCWLPNRRALGQRSRMRATMSGTQPVITASVDSNTGNVTLTVYRGSVSEAFG